MLRSRYMFENKITRGFIVLNHLSILALFCVLWSDIVATSGVKGMVWSIAVCIVLNAAMYWVNKVFSDKLFDWQLASDELRYRDTLLQRFWANGVFIVAWLLVILAVLVPKGGII